MKIIFNADDFGISKAASLGIIEAHKKGVIKSTSLMCNMKDAEYAANMAKGYKDLGVGIHFVITAGSPLHNNVPSLTDENGQFKKNEVIMNTAVIEDIRKEFNAQFEKFLSFGMTPTHIDSHHHMHQNDMVLTVVKELADKYKLPIRTFQGLNMDGLSDMNKKIYEVLDYYGSENISVESLISILEKYKNKEIIEIMCHPAYADDQLFQKTSYAKERNKELVTLTSKELQEYIEKNNIQIINYSSIK